MEPIDKLIKISRIEDHILHLQLNRPQQLNALSHGLLKILLDTVQEAKQDHTIKALLLTGEGKAFCAGADIKQLAVLNSTAGLAFARFGQEVFSAIEELGKPSLAAIHGFAFGGGCELAMSTTLRIATDQTIFGQPEIKLGVIPGFGGTQRLTRLIGKGRAMEICLTGRRFTAEEAWRWGFLNEVVPADDLLTRATAILKEIIQYSPIPLQSILDVIHQGNDLSLAEALELEAVHFGICCSTSDKQEGVNAFLEKRAPAFSGA